MKLGMQVGLGLGHIVLDGDPAPPSSKGAQPPPNFRPISVAAKCCMDQYVTWYGGMVGMVQVQAQVLVFYAFYIFEKFNRTQSIPLCTVAPHKADS